MRQSGEEAVKLSWPGDKPEEKMPKCGFKLEKSLIEEETGEARPMVLTDAIEAILGVPRVFLSVVLKGCVSWAKENGVTLITAEHMQMINDKRSKEKTKSKIKRRQGRSDFKWYMCRCRAAEWRRI